MSDRHIPPPRPSTDTLMSRCSADSDSRLAQKHLLITNRPLVTLREDSIKGNLWHIVTFFKDQGRKSLESDSTKLPNCQTANLTPSPLPAHPLTLSPSLANNLAFPFPLSPRFYSSLSFSHSETLSLFSACFLSPPESWYEVRGGQRDRSSDPGWISPVYAAEMHGGTRENRRLHAGYISRMCWVWLGPLGICDVKKILSITDICEITTTRAIFSLLW